MVLLLTGIAAQNLSMTAVYHHRHLLLGDPLQPEMSAIVVLLRPLQVGAVLSIVRQGPRPQMIVALVLHPVLFRLHLPSLEIDPQDLVQMKTIDLLLWFQDLWMIVGLRFLADPLLRLLGDLHLLHLVRLKIVVHQDPLLAKIEMQHQGLLRLHYPQL